MIDFPCDSWRMPPIIYYWSLDFPGDSWRWAVPKTVGILLSVSQSIWKPCWSLDIETDNLILKTLKFSAALSSDLCPNQSDIGNKPDLCILWYVKLLFNCNQHPLIMGRMKDMKYLFQARQTLFHNWIQFLLNRKKILYLNLRMKWLQKSPTHAKKRE